MSQAQPHYHIEKINGQWTVNRIDQPCRISKVDSRAEGRRIAALLAGWNGKVTTGKRA